MILRIKKDLAANIINTRDSEQLENYLETHELPHLLWYGTIAGVRQAEYKWAALLALASPFIALVMLIIAIA